MKKTLVAVALIFASAGAFGFHCPVDMKKIDEHLATNPDISAEDMSKVQELRTAGEDLHNNGQHHASVAVLAEAMRVLGI
jgi:hypothetical protein